MKEREQMGGVQMKKPELKKECGMKTEGNGYMAAAQEQDVVDLGTVRSIEDLSQILRGGASDSRKDGKAAERLRLERGKRPSSAGIPVDDPNGDERPSLEEILQGAAAGAKVKARTSAPSSAGARGSAGAAASSPNDLFSTYADVFAELAGRFSEFALYAGVGGSRGFENPSRSFARKVRSGDFDDMSAVDYDQLYESVRQISMLWEGMPAAHGPELAKNLLLVAILHDEGLRTLALATAHSLVAEHCANLEKFRYQVV